MSEQKKWILAVDDWIARGAIPDKDAPSMQALERLEGDDLLRIDEIRGSGRSAKLLISWTGKGKYEVDRLRAGGALPIHMP